MKYVAGFLIAVALVVGLYAGLFERSQQEEVREVPVGQNRVRSWSTISDDQPPVTLRVTPIEIGASFQKWKFRVVFDTHSGSLDHDVFKVIAFVDDNGRELSPQTWEGPGPGGHHREGVVVFDIPDPVPKKARLIIKGVGDIPQRDFAWDL